MTGSSWAVAGVTVLQGDARALTGVPDDSIDAIVCDPPYNLAFMGREWDTVGGPAEFARWCERWAREAFRVLRPGGHMLAFGGTRTAHRMVCGVEDAGFEIRDTITWIYASGFPKSLDASKAIDRAAGVDRVVVDGVTSAPNGKVGGYAGARYKEPRVTSFGMVQDQPDRTRPETDEARRWEGWGTALKPAWEPIVAARKPLAGTVAANVLEHGTGALNIDGCRVPSGLRPLRVTARNADTSSIFGQRDGISGVSGGETSNGRWPSNVVWTHAPECDPEGACVSGCPVAELDGQSGNVKGAVSNGSKTDRGLAGSSTFRIHPREQRPGYADEGGASRFFPVFYYTAKAPGHERPEVDGTQHPTVKPVDLMRWLIRLVTPPGGRGLDMFAGSGSTGEAAVLEGFEWVLVEQEEKYLPLILQRLEPYRDPVTLARARGRGERPKRGRAVKRDPVDDGLF